MVPKCRNSPHHNLLPLIEELAKIIIANNESELGITRAILIGILYFSGKSRLRIKIQIARDILAAIGGIKEEEEIASRMKRIIYRFISVKSVENVLSLYLIYNMELIEECDQILQVATKVARWSVKDSLAICSGLLQDLHLMACCCSVLAQAEVTGKNYISFMKLLTMVFKTCTSLCKLVIIFLQVPCHYLILLLDQITKIAHFRRICRVVSILGWRINGKHLLHVTSSSTSRD